MPHSQSAAKRVRQTEKRRLHNKAIMSTVRTKVKRFRALVAEGNIEEAKAAYIVSEKSLDQAAAKGVLHKNTVNRYKSRLALLLNRTAPKAQ